MKILPLRKRSIEEVKIHALSDQLQDLVQEVHALRQTVHRLLLLLKNR